MEEKKSKVVSMNNAEKPLEKKLTYEQLNDACNQLWQQNKQLVIKNKELEQYVINKRMDYLFKVLEYANLGRFTSDFVTNCAKEIEEALTIPQEPENKEK